MANCECHNQVGYIFYVELMVFSTTGYISTYFNYPTSVFWRWSHLKWGVDGDITNKNADAASINLSKM